LNKDLALRLDQVESHLAIQQLAVRYALAVDSRDIESWLQLFAPDVDCGSYGKGREALRRSIVPGLRSFYRSIHLVCGHSIDFDGPNSATGKVYCRAEHEDGPKWVVVPLLYHDSYVRQDGRWYFARRSDRSWYSADVLDRPGSEGLQTWQPLAGRDPALPRTFDTWAGFWDAAAPGTVEALTSFPVPSPKRQGPDK